MAFWFFLYHKARQNLKNRMEKKANQIRAKITRKGKFLNQLFNLLAKEGTAIMFFFFFTDDKRKRISNLLKSSGQ